MSEEEQKAIDILKRTIKNSNYCDSIGTGQIEIVLNYIDKLQKENDELQADKNKLINYIAIRENKTYEEVCKEFEV